MAYCGKWHDTVTNCNPCIEVEDTNERLLVLLRIVVTNVKPTSQREASCKLTLDLNHNPSADDQTGRILDRFRFGLLQVGNSDHFKLVIALTVFLQLCEPVSWPRSSAHPCSRRHAF